MGPKVTDLLDGRLVDYPSYGEVPRQIILDERPFARVDLGAIPRGYASVAVKVDDCGDISNCEMIAGHIGWHILPRASAHPPAGPLNSVIFDDETIGSFINPESLTTATAAKQKDANNGFGDTVRPASAWFIFEKKVDPVREMEQKRKDEEFERKYREAWELDDSTASSPAQSDDGLNRELDEFMVSFRAERDRVEESAQSTM